MKNISEPPPLGPSAPATSVFLNPISPLKKGGPPSRRRFAPPQAERKRLRDNDSSLMLRSAAGASRSIIDFFNGQLTFR